MRYGLFALPRICLGAYIRGLAFSWFMSHCACMNKDSRTKGKGERRIVKPRSVREPEFTKPAPVEPKSTEVLAKMRQHALTRLADSVDLAIDVLIGSLDGPVERRQGTRSSDARYVLDVVLDRLPAPSEQPPDTEVDEDGNAAPTPVDELAVRRAELQKLLRAQRKDADRDKRK